MPDGGRRAICSVLPHSWSKLDAEGSERLVPEWRRGCRACIGRICLMQIGPAAEQAPYAAHGRQKTCRYQSIRKLGPIPACRSLRPGRRRQVEHRFPGPAHTISHKVAADLACRARQGEIRQCVLEFPNQQSTAEGRSRARPLSGSAPLSSLRVA